MISRGSGSPSGNAPAETFRDCPSPPARRKPRPSPRRGRSVPSPGPRLALLSVHDKAGILDLARVLLESGFRILSTGGTGRALREARLPVTEVSEHTGFP